MAEGYKWRNEQARIRIAYFVVPIINACHTIKLRTPVTMETLLGYDPADPEKKKRQEVNRKKSGRQLKSELSDLMAKMGGR